MSHRSETPENRASRCLISSSDFRPSAGSRQDGRSIIALCPARFIPRLIPLESPARSEDSPFLREPDRARSQEIAQYLAGNPDTYVLPTLTCLVAGAVDFDENGGSKGSTGMGTLRVPLNSRILILDGVNRLAGVESALKIRPELGDEAVPILFYVETSPAASSRCSPTSVAMVQGPLGPRESSVICATKRPGSRGS